MPRTDYAQTEKIRAMTVQPDDAKSIAESIVPYYTDDTKKAKYLSYRVSNFSVLESCKLAGDGGRPIHIKTVRRWREADPNFYAIDVTNIGEVRKQLSSQFLDIEFTRNFRLILQKDFEVIMNSMNGVEMSKLDQDYFLKLRGHYTPQNLAVIKQLLGGGTVDAPFDFTRFVMTISREKQTLEIKSE